MTSFHSPKLCAKASLTTLREVLLGTQPLCQAPNHLLAPNHSSLHRETRKHSAQNYQIFATHDLAGTTLGGRVGVETTWNIK